MILKSSRHPIKGTTHKVRNDNCGKRRDDRSSISRGKQRLHITTLTSYAYIEEPRTNNNYLRSERYDLLGILGIGKYGSIGEHYFDRIHCSDNVYG